MISGKPASRYWLALASLLAICNSATGSGLTIDTLMQEFSSITSAKAHFREHRILAVLDKPVITEGTLSYQRPDYLRKEVLQPTHSTFEIDGDRLTIESAQGYHEFSLASQPMLRAFTVSYSALLAGDAELLRRHYTAELTGSRDLWTMHLTPKNTGIQERIKNIMVTGSQNQIKSVEVFEATGDSSHMVITAYEN
jgi:outer membrane lipoprotein-sorting protein